MKTRRFPDSDANDEKMRFHEEHIGVEPMLLALSMELALKAWFVFDFDNSTVPRLHDLSELFDLLLPQSQELLDLEFKRSVAPIHPSGLHIDYSIRHLLYHHKDAFIDWRYLHEPGKSMMFDRAAFEATLEMVLLQFESRYREDPITPVWR